MHSSYLLTMNSILKLSNSIINDAFASLSYNILNIIEYVHSHRLIDSQSVRVTDSSHLLMRLIEFVETRESYIRDLFGSLAYD